MKLIHAENNFLEKWCSQPWPCVAFSVKERRILHANQAAASLYGYSAREMSGISIQLLFSDHSIEEFIAILTGHSGRLHFGGVWEHSTKAHTSLYVELEGTCCEWEGQNVCLLTINDVSGPASLAFRLEVAHTRFESIFNFAVDGIYQSSPDGRLLSANPAFAHLLGYVDATEAVRMLYPLKEKLYVDQTKRELFKKVLDEHGIAHDLEFEAYRKDGSKIWLSFNARSVKNTFGQTVYYEGFVQDITSQKQTQAKLEKALLDLKRSNEDLERFTYIASHDLQEPLRTVTSYITLLKNRYQDSLDETANEFIGFAVGGVHRMRRLIEDLSTYSRLGIKKKPFTPCDLNIILDTVLLDLSDAIESNRATIEKQLVMPTIVGDCTQIRQLFLNVIGNALKYHFEKETKISLKCQEFPDHLLFEVADNGQGFEPEYGECIFQAFRRLHGSDYPGTGMGLAICKRIVERHGGNIWASSEPGIGSTFFFRLSREPDAEQTW